ncbi:hypothetical protein ALT721_2570002 [Alteromonas alvinellae]
MKNIEKSVNNYVYLKQTFYVSRFLYRLIRRVVANVGSF